MDTCGTLLSRKDAINILVKSPYSFGRSVGFKLLTELHNGWIKSMVYGNGDKTLQAHRG